MVAAMGDPLKEMVHVLQKRARKAKDFDPEDEPFSDGSNSSESENESLKRSTGTGKEHYEAVSKSRLRQPEKVELDSKRYASQPVSRATLGGDDDFDPLAPEEEIEDDPFALRNESVSDDDDLNSPDANGLDSQVNDDDEIDSDQAFEDGDGEDLKSKGFVFRGSGKSLTVSEVESMDESDDNEDFEADAKYGSESISNDDDDDLDMDGMNDEDESGDDDQDSDSGESEGDHQDTESANIATNSGGSAFETHRDRLRALMSADTAAISASLSQAASADVKKGQAVKRQYQTFDRFLDARIKLQKGLTAANSLDLSLGEFDAEVQEAASKAEEAALRLFATIESVRHSIRDATVAVQTEPDTKKRKRSSSPTMSTSTIELHERIKDIETANTPHRRNTLDKWSLKTRAANASLSSRSRSQAEDPVSKLTTVLDAYLLSSGPKLVEDAQTLIASSIDGSNDKKTNRNSTTILNKPEAGVEEQEPGKHEKKSPRPNLPPFQDTQFYQSLLRDLISTKSYLNNNSNNNLSSIQPINSNPWSQTPKTHRQVDRKASKGRKVRYTVHEKLENFMAATGRLHRGAIVRNGTGSGGGPSANTSGFSSWGNTTTGGDYNNNNNNNNNNNDHWTDAAVREFFGSLMGMKNQLAEASGDDDDDNEGEEEEDIYGGGAANGEVQALKLFRS